jgi:hypothetical protein
VFSGCAPELSALGGGKVAVRVARSEVSPQACFFPWTRNHLMPAAPSQVETQGAATQDSGVRQRLIVRKQLLASACVAALMCASALLLTACGQSSKSGDTSWPGIRCIRTKPGACHSRTVAAAVR